MTNNAPRPPSRRLDVAFGVLFALTVLVGLASRIPTGPPTEQEGRVTAIERNWRNGVYAVFTAADGTPDRHAPPARDPDCRPGDVIQLLHRPRLIGSGYSTAGDDPCRPPLP